MNVGDIQKEIKMRDYNASKKEKKSSYPTMFSFHKAQMHPNIRSCEMGLYPFLFVLPCIPCNQTIFMTNTEEELRQKKKSQ